MKQNKRKQQSKLISEFRQLAIYRTPKAKTHKQIQIVFQNTAEEFSHKHFGKAIFITFGLNTQTKRSIAEEWNIFVNNMPKVIKVIDRHYTTAGFIMGIELYQKNKNRANNKSFKPHAHMVLFAYNEFMASPNYELSSQLIELGLDVKVDALPKPKDVANAMRYTLKSANDELTNKATQAFMSMPPTSFFINTALESNPLLKVENFIHKPTIPMLVHKEPLYWKVPSVQRHNDLKYSAAQFLKLLCIQQKIGFYKTSLLKRNEGSYYTWQTWKPVNQFIDALAQQQHMPPSYKEFLLDNAPWIIKEGATSTTEAIHVVFPRVTMSPHLWEFKYGYVYNFNVDQCEQTNLTEFISCSRYINEVFSELPEPTQLLKFINVLTQSASETRMLLKTMGGLFHKLTESRKEQKALWVHGTNNTYKTWLVATFLDKCFHHLLISRVPQGASPFQFAALRNNEEGVVFIDDFRSQAFKTNAPEFLNIVDGTPTSVQEKYKSSEVVEYKGHFAITSNEEIDTTEFKRLDQQALKQRFHEVELVPSKELSQRSQYPNFPDNQWYALAILANRLFLGNKVTNQQLLE